MDTNTTEICIDQGNEENGFSEVKTTLPEKPLNEEETEKDKMKKRLSWKEFYSSTTVHGFHFIFDETGVRRIVWALIFLGAFFLSGYLFIGVIYEFSSFSTLTSWAEEYAEEAPPFPSLTICTYQSKVRNTISQNKTLDEELWNTYNKYLKAYSGNKPDGFTEELKQAMKNSNTTSVSEFLSLYELNLNDMTEDKSMELFRDMGLRCSFDGVVCNKTWFRTSLLAFYGACFELNYFEPDKEDRKMHNILPGFWFMANIHSQDIELASVYPFDGIALHIHKYGTAPISQHTTVIPLSPGTLNIVELTTSKTKLLNYPYKNSCGGSKYKIIKSTFPYTKGTCELDCIAKIIYNRIGCLGYYYERLVDPKYICGPDKYLEYKFETETIFTYEQECRKKCVNECELLAYKVTNNNVPLGTKHDIKELSRMKNFTYEEAENYIRSNIVGINVRFAKRTIMTSNVVPAVTWKSMLGSLGGNLGLCLGISILTVCEFLYFGFNNVLNIYHKWILRRK